MKRKVKYTCVICGFTTDLKSQIHIHHIQPRQIGGSNNKWNLVQLCPRCHSMVYSPYSKQGIHSKKGNQSFQILGWRNNGTILECKNINTNQIYYIEKP